MVRIRAAVLAILILSAPSAAPAAEYLLAPYLSFPVGDVLEQHPSPSWGSPDVAAGDLNGDGRADLAVVSRDGWAIEGGRTLSILLANSNPVLPLFGAPVNYETGFGPQSVAIADLNNDGWLDVVTADAGDNVISIFLNQGGGKLGPRTSYPTGSSQSPGALVLADLNADGRRDIVLCIGSGVSIFLASGFPGVFAPPTAYATTGTARGVAVGLVDGDAIPDVVAVASSPDVFSVFHGVGDGTLTLTSAPLLLHPPNALQLADMNGDGRPEALVASSLAGRVTVYANNGMAPFTSTSTDKAVAGPLDILARDLNADSKMDVAVASQQPFFAPTATGFFVPGDGLGGLGTPSQIDVGAHLEAVAAGDFDGDGMVDLAFTGAGMPVDLRFRRAVHVARQKSPGVFSIPTFYIKPEITMGTAVTTVEDMNRDGMPDLVIAGLGFASGQASIAVRLGTSSESWDPGTLTNIPGDFPPRAVAGDFNRDGIPDLAVTENSSTHGLLLKTYLGDGTGAITPIVASATADREALAAGDFDRDGILDLVTNALAGIVLLKGVGDGTFTFGSSLFTGNSVGAAAVGDLNQDGALDIVYSVNALGTNVSLGNGTIVLNAPTAPPGPPATSITLADFNEDSKLDVLLSTATQTFVGLGDGLGTFSSAVQLLEYQNGNGSFSSAALDMNRDGHMDVIADVNEPSGSDYIDSNLRLWLGDGNGGFGTRHDYGVPEHPLGLTLVDATRDGRTDVVSSSIGPLLGAEKAVRHYTLKGNGPPAFAFPTAIVNSTIPASTQTAIATADFTLDGTPDVVVAHSLADGNFYSTMMVGNGNGTFTPSFTNILPDEPSAMDVGDFNRDGIPDVAIGCAAGDAVLVQFGSTADTLTTPVALALGLGYEFSDIAVADFNRDGKPDIAAASAASSIVLIFRGKGDGTFFTNEVSTGSFRPTSITVGDENRDGIPDLIVALGVGINPNSIGVLHGIGDGRF
ncbi:MAG TPA: VCBS repeat-containing protein, partial [Candidatus Eisenbacteria bacterium]|nr:VCBS repeat-containing protein [Candidatus Eisenbacteria bacterium]